MSVPNYQALMLPLLKVLGTAGHELHTDEYSSQVADLISLAPEDREAMLPSGLQTYIRNRSGWAGWYMMQAGLLEKPRPGYLRITDEGKRLLAAAPPSIDNKFLATYPAFRERLKRQEPDTSEAESDGVLAKEDDTPTEMIEKAHRKLNDSLASDLLDLMRKMDPFRFEQLVIDLLFAMGYGGSRAEAALVTQRTSDEGIDGVISEDRLGLDMIYVQAKRWQSTIGRVEVQNFVGALVGKHATKGVFITTSDFHRNAVDYARSVQHKVILIDGRRLADLMIEFGVGVATVRTIAIKRLDSDYFSE